MAHYDWFHVTKVTHRTRHVSKMLTALEPIDEHPTSPNRFVAAAAPCHHLWDVRPISPCQSRHGDTRYGLVVANYRWHEGDLALGRSAINPRRAILPKPSLPDDQGD
ncbi:hypothetical protein CRG98_010425 [Punica granatum]|uniref:Uncharacterized protein n=1 Tax=Punica granatum TaxID=22663 RepID=A0A2I0KKW5_PUNGR|nr:hypothetical protein CRG98_010425 [Punica granatum]